MEDKGAEDAAPGKGADRGPALSVSARWLGALDERWPLRGVVLGWAETSRPWNSLVLSD